MITLLWGFALGYFSCMMAWYFESKKDVANAEKCLERARAVETKANELLSRVNE